MKWVQCNECHAETPVADNDDPSEWEEPCEICGGRNWKVENETRNSINTRSNTDNSSDLSNDSDSSSHRSKG